MGFIKSVKKRICYKPGDEEVLEFIFGVLSCIIWKVTPMVWGCPNECINEVVKST